MRSQALSGLSIAAYCRRVRVSQASYFAWRRKLRDAGSFAEVRVTPESAGEAGAFEVWDADVFEVRDAGVFELKLKRGRRIVVRPGFDRATLLALYGSLRPGEDRRLPDKYARGTPPKMGKGGGMGLTFHAT